MTFSLFEGDLAVFGQTLLSADDPRALVPVSELLRADTLDPLLMRVYGPDLMPSQLPVLVSQWSKYYFMQLIPPVAAASLVHGWHWPLGLDRVGFALSERGLLDGVRFSGAGGVAVLGSTDPFLRFGPLLDHLQRVVEMLSAYSSVAPGVLWSNAGDYLETCLKQLGAVSAVSLAAGYALLNDRTRPDGRRNPLFNAITYIDGAGGQRRQRRSCCLSHRVEWVGRCEHCPLNASSS
ncbi:MAG TPA: siderophore-iron reductase FhuF [Pseudomonas sp.]|uniref:siderophore-iron reductase FhuF n=1 Tax=Pseudomonas sp. TaxID=306 RepID=UPI002ED90645